MRRAEGGNNTGRRALVAGLVVAAALAATLISPLAIQAEKQHYEGGVEPQEWQPDAAADAITFDVIRKAGDRKVKYFRGERVPLLCGSNPGSGTFGVRTIDVRNRRFRYEAGPKVASTRAADGIYRTPFALEGLGRPPGLPPRIDLTGRLRQGGRASGTLRVRVFTIGIEEPSCDSGVMEWQATR